MSAGFRIQANRDRERPGYVERWDYEYGYVLPNGERVWIVPDQYGNNKGEGVRDERVKRIEHELTNLGVPYTCPLLRRRKWVREFKAVSWVSDVEVQR